MRIGLTGAGSTADRLVEQARRAEADGFTSMWYPSAAGAGDPLAAMTLAGRATSAIELGTAVLVTYSAHPVFQASRANAVVSAIGTPGRFTLGVGPSHRVVIEDRLGLSYDTPGQHTDEYVQILAGLLRGEQVSFAGQEFRVEAGPLPLHGRSGNPGPGRGPGHPAAAGRGLAHGWHDLVDGQRHGDRAARGAGDPQGRR